MLLGALAKGKKILKNTRAIKAQFSLALNWAFMALGGFGMTGIEIMYILV